MKLPPVALATVITVALLSWGTALGCPRCFGLDRGRLLADCQRLCRRPMDGFPPGKAQDTCTRSCEKFIQTDHCCSPTCLALTNTCLKPSGIEKRDTVTLMDSRVQLEKVKRDPPSLDMPALLAREPPYDAIGTTAELRALHPRALETWQVDTGLSEPQEGALVERGNPQICCNLARIITNGGVLAIAGATGTDNSDQQYAAMLAIAVGFATSSACSRWYAIVCNP